MQDGAAKTLDLLKFQEHVKRYYKVSGRHNLPWRLPNTRGQFDPYKIFISEIMLQQTQVQRVVPKYQQFWQAFPSLDSLAAAPLGSVLRVWSGLGYNRRAKFLHEAAKTLMNEHRGSFPKVVEELTLLPGIGKNTAAAIIAYSFNLPVTFIETNIRTVYLHHFFPDKTEVPDNQLLPLITETVDLKKPREWYWALMDYGSFLKSTEGNANIRSKHYIKQSSFQGSRRQIRGSVLKLLDQPLNFEKLAEKITDQRLRSVVDDLLKEGLISLDGNLYTLGK